MKLSGMKKIVLLGLILIIVAGAVVVALKGFNVSLIYEQHETIKLVIGKKIEISDIENICKEVFNDKKVIIRKIELFDDAVNIDVESVTDEEKGNLVNKVNEKYGTTFTVETINITTNPNIRLRDIVRPYIVPLFISAIVIVAYMVIKFRKINTITLLGKIAGIIILTELFIASCISIGRVPLTPSIINIMIAFAIFELVLYIDYTEKNYKTLKD